VDCPPFAKTLIVADDARLAAQLSCRLIVPGAYLPIIDGPRLTRPDAAAEIMRRSNAVARVQPDEILLAGLSSEAHEAMRARFGETGVRVSSVTGIGDVPKPLAAGELGPLSWGRERIGVGVLTALRARRSIEFSDGPSPEGHVASKWGHLVVCEEGEDLSEVIAANYAYALRAGLYIIPETDKALAERLLEAFYSLDEQSGGSGRAQSLRRLQAELRQLSGPLPLAGVHSLTFVTSQVPFGFAFPEMPATHLFKYPDLGLSIINGFSAEQPNTHGTGVAALVDPAVVPAPEISSAAERLARRGMFVRHFSGSNADVRSVSELVELFPYDLLLIATHFGDADGWRWTYEYTDSEGRERRLVVDVAIGVAPTDDNDRFAVTQFTRFVSLDGVDWSDPDKDKKLYVGNAIKDYAERKRADSPNPLEPTIREPISRVRWSAAMKMHDGNYIAMDPTIADVGTPIILNNACGSLHRLGGSFTFAGARAYIGTLFPIMGVEAQHITAGLFGAHFGKPLPTALWRAQREVHDDSFRWPYVMIGVYPQRLRFVKHDVPRRVAQNLSTALRHWQARLPALQANRFSRERTEATINYYSRELQGFLKIWPKALARSLKGEH
jgi:hypothetical protein